MGKGRPLPATVFAVQDGEMPAQASSSRDIAMYRRGARSEVEHSVVLRLRSKLFHQGLGAPGTLFLVPTSSRSDAVSFWRDFAAALAHGVVARFCKALIGGGARCAHRSRLGPACRAPCSI